MTDNNFTIVFDETWPFLIRIVNGDREVGTFQRVLMSSDWKSLDDVREARGWRGMSSAPTAQSARDLIARQEREVCMFAASFDLYDALKEARIALNGGPVTDGLCHQVDGAIRKAEGLS